MIPKGVSQYNPRWLNAAPVPAAGGNVTPGTLPNGGGSASAVGQPNIAKFDGFHVLNDNTLYDEGGFLRNAPANSTPGDVTPNYPSSQYGGGVTSYTDAAVAGGVTPKGRTTGKEPKLNKKFDDSTGA